MRPTWFLLAVTACAPGADELPAGDHIIPEKVADLPGYSEGIAFDSHGTAFFSVGRNPSDAHAVYKLSLGGAPAVWLSLRIPNGHKVLADGTHLIAGEGVILHVTPLAQILDSLTGNGEQGKLERPNDVALDGHGGFYFTDPGQPDAGALAGRIFYVTSAFRLTLAADSFCYPNGLVVRPDGRALYLDDSCNGRVYQVPIHAPGVLGTRAVIASIPDSGESGLDGMTLDASGRLYIAHNGVGRIEVLDTLGHLLRQYPAGVALASNVAFGGPGLQDLYVTGSRVPKSGPGALYRLRLSVRGRSSMALPAP